MYMRRAVAAIAVIAAAGLPTVAVAAPASATPAVTALATRLAPKVPADNDGYPIKRCGPENDGEKVDTEDVEGGRHRFVCKFVDDLFGDDGWEWNEILLM